jgi:hypothetical protein
MKRRRFKQTIPLKGRLTAWAKDVMAQAQTLPPGPERDELIKKARQADTAAHIDDWANSPGLRPPT